MKKETIEYIEKYQTLWCGTGFQNYYLVINNDDLWEHYFCKNLEDTEKYKTRITDLTIYKIGSNKFK